MRWPRHPRRDKDCWRKERRADRPSCCSPASPSAWAFARARRERWAPPEEREEDDKQINRYWTSQRRMEMQGEEHISHHQHQHPVFFLLCTMSSVLLRPSYFLPLPSVRISIVFYHSSHYFISFFHSFLFFFLYFSLNFLLLFHVQNLLCNSFSSSLYSVAPMRLFSFFPLCFSLLFFFFS